MDSQIKQCRICMDNSLQFHSMDSCSTDYPYRTLRENFNFCTHLDAQKNDQLPNVICKACFKDLNSAVEFVQRARDADTHFRGLLASSGALSAPVLSSPDSIEIKQEECEQFETIEPEHNAADVQPSEDDCSDEGIAEVTNPIKVGNIECSSPGKKRQRMSDEKEKPLTIIICNICGESCSERELKAHVAQHQGDLILDDYMEMKVVTSETSNCANDAPNPTAVISEQGAELVRLIFRDEFEKFKTEMRKMVRREPAHEYVRPKMVCSEFEKMNNFPLKTTDDLKIFEEKIKANEDLRQKFKSYIMKIGGRTAKDAVKILNRMYDLALQNKISYTGREQNKFPVKNLAHIKIIIELLGDAYDITEAEATQILQKYLYQTCDRIRCAAAKKAKLNNDNSFIKLNIS